METLSVRLPEGLAQHSVDQAEAGPHKELTVVTAESQGQEGPGPLCKVLPTGPWSGLLPSSKKPPDPEHRSRTSRGTGLQLEAVGRGSASGNLKPSSSCLVGGGCRPLGTPGGSSKVPWTHLSLGWDSGRLCRGEEGDGFLARLLPSRGRRKFSQYGGKGMRLCEVSGQPGEGDPGREGAERPERWVAPLPAARGPPSLRLALCAAGGPPGVPEGRRRHA